MCAVVHITKSGECYYKDNDYLTLAHTTTCFTTFKKCIYSHLGDVWCDTIFTLTKKDQYCFTHLYDTSLKCGHTFTSVDINFNKSP